MSAYQILVIVAIIIAIASMIWPKFPLLAVAVLLLGVALLTGGR